MTENHIIFIFIYILPVPLFIGTVFRLSIKCLLHTHTLIILGVKCKYSKILEKLNSFDNFVYLRIMILIFIQIY
jgi:hypothetical protein